MRRCAWMRSRMVKLVVAFSLALPMGTPSVFAMPRRTDDLRQIGTRHSVKDGAEPSASERIEGELREPQGPQAAGVVTPRRMEADVEGLLAYALLESMGLGLRWQHGASETVASLSDDTLTVQYTSTASIQDVVRAISRALPGTRQQQLGRVLTLLASNSEIPELVPSIAGGAPEPGEVIAFARAQAATANPTAGPLYVGALVPQADSVGALVDSLKGIVAISSEGAVQVVDEHRLRTETVHQLAAESFLSPVPDVKAAAQWLLRAIGPQVGTGEASAYRLHQARAAGKWGRATIPAFNIRTGPPYHTLMTLFDAAIEQRVGALMVEIAKSEQGYAIDIEEFVAAVYAAAIARGFTGPLFVQADHYQITPEAYRADPKKAVDAMRQHVLRSVQGGMLNIDLDSSTLVRHDIVEQRILPLKVAYTNRYLQARLDQDPVFAQWLADRGGLKAGIAKKEGETFARIYDEQPEIRALRHKVWDDLMVVALEEAGPQVLEQALGKGQVRLPDLKPYLEQMELTIPQEQARYVNPVTAEGRAYNSPELYGMSAVDYHESLRGVQAPEGFEQPFITREELKTLIGLYRDIQRDNLAASLELLVSIRQYERQQDLSTIDVTYEEEHTDNPILVNEHPSSALGTIVFTGLALRQAEQAGVEPFTTVALQTGTMHGIGGDPDWGIHDRINLVLADSGIAGTDQHGTSTINAARFADMPTVGVLSDHLATEYQKYTFAMIAKVPELVDQIGQFLEGVLYPDRPIADPAIAAKVKGAAGKPSGKKLQDFQTAWEQAMREGEAAGLSRQQIVANLITDNKALGKVKGKLKDVTKLASKPFAVEISQLSPELKAENYLQHVEEFRRIFRVQNVADTRELVQQYAGFDPAQVVLPPSPAVLVEAVRASAGSAQLPPSIQVAQALARQQLAFASDEPPAQLAPALRLAAEAANNTATLMVAEHIRGSVDPSDKKGIREQGKKGDVRAKEIYALTIAARGARVLVKGNEGVGRTEGLTQEEAFDANEVVNPRGLGEQVSGYLDVIENTKLLPSTQALHWSQLPPATSGTTSMAVLTHGNGIGSITDDAYVGVFFGVVDPSKGAGYITDPLNPHAETRETIEPQLRRLAQDAPGGPKTLSQMTVHVFNRPREEKRLASLQAIAADNPGMEIVWDYPDGTVRHITMASAGSRDGRQHVALLSGGPDEAAGNLGIAKALSRSHGAVGSLLFYSRNLPSTPKGGEAEQGEAKDLSNGLVFDAQDRSGWQRLRDDSASITDGTYTEGPNVQGHRLFTIGDWDGDVYAVLPTITNDRVFNLPGAVDLGNGLVRNTTVYVQQQGDEPGRIWVDVSDDSVADVQRTLARGQWAMSDPAAADLSAVDPDGRLLARMEGPAPYTIALGDPEALSANSPTLWLQIQQALEAFQARRGLKTIEEAAAQSAVKFVIAASPALSTGENGVPVARVTLPVSPNLSLESIFIEVRARYQAVEIRQSEQVVDDGTALLHVDFSGAQAAEAAQFFLLRRTGIATLAQQAAEARVDRLFAAVSKGTADEQDVTLAQPKREWFTVTVDAPQQAADAAIGSRAWLATLPASVKTKVALEAPAEDGYLLPGAAAVVVAAVGMQDPLAGRLKAVEADGVVVIPPATIVKETEAVVTHYQETVSGV